MSEAAQSSDARSVPAFGALPFGIAIAVAIALKLVLLFTSQSMADGDEAVEGLMAMHILQDGVHPIYPYGVQYGAGAGVEAHLATVFFAIFGPSSIALKAAGLCIWLVSGGLVHAIAKQQWGVRAGRLALLAWMFAPFAAQWSLKVAGGHNVAVALSLFALWLGVCREKRYAAACVVPLAAMAHPVALSLSLGIAAVLLLRAPPGQRLRVAGVLLLSGCAVLWLLWPEGEGLWNPVSRGLDPGAIAQALPVVAAGLFTANLNSKSLPGLFDAAVACVWALGAAISLFSVVATRSGLRRDGVWLLPLAASLGALLIVQPEELAARHFLPVLPILCLLLGRLLAGLRPAPALAFLLVLVASGAAVQLREVASPTIHGAGPQGRGVDRANVLQVLDDLASERVHYVYSGDAMLQWMLIFESGERVIARWREPLDRVPRYPREVDRARRAGLPIRLVVVADRPEPGAPMRFEVRGMPHPDQIERIFPPAPAAPGG